MRAQGIFADTLLTISPSTDVLHTGQGPRHATPISTLSDDVLLEIFHFCQKNHYPGFRPGTLPEAVWDWHILVHVCRRWRQVVFASPLRLNLQILCTHGTPVRKNLNIWPPFPINIEYISRKIKGYREDNVLAALEHPGRVSAVSLLLTGPQMGKIAMVMQEPFPELRHLHLGQYHISNNVPVLSSEFLGRSAPRLEAIFFIGIAFPVLPALLLSASNLVTLCLQEIPQTGYIPPEAMAAGLVTLTRLESLLLKFQSPDPHPDRMHLPPATRTVLPSLTFLCFCGVHEYLEDILAWISAPLLDQIFIEYFNQFVDFEVPQLWQFIDHTEDLSQLMRCEVRFQHNDVAFVSRLTTQISEPLSFDCSPFYIKVRILCKRMDKQVSHIAQALNRTSTTSTMLSNMLHLAIKYDFGFHGPEPWDIDDIEWLELLRPFSSVQTLFVSKEFAGHVSRSLENTAVMATEVLPALDMICLEGQSVSSGHIFIAARSESGRPVTTVDTKAAFDERLMSYVNQS